MNRKQNQANRFFFIRLILKGVRPISNVTSHSVILVGMITFLLVWAGLPPTGTIQVGAYGGLPQTSEKRSLQTDSVKIYLPRISHPALCLNGSTIELVVEAPDDASNWQAALWREYRSYPLNIGATEYDGTKGRWSLNASIPGSTSPDLYDLHINLKVKLQRKVQLID